MSEQLLKIAPGARNVVGEAAAGGDLRLHPLSVDQYHRMIDEGILDEDTGTELLDGVLVGKDRGDPGEDPRTVGEAHAHVVRQLAYLGLRLDPARMHLQTQQPVVIAEHGEPEPDAAIVLQPVTATAKPRAQDVSCVIEVAGTSLGEAVARRQIENWLAPSGRPSARSAGPNLWTRNLAGVD